MKAVYFYNYYSIPQFYNELRILLSKQSETPTRVSIEILVRMEKFKEVNVYPPPEAT